MNIGFSASPADAQVTSVIEKKALKFGDVAGDGSLTSSVTISVTGVKTVSGGAFDFGGQSAEAEFTVSGTKRTDFVISLPTSVLLSNGSSTATLQNFVSDPPAGVTQTFPNSGKATVRVGATLVLGPGQNAGEYTGSYVIDVDPQ